MKYVLLTFIKKNCAIIHLEVSLNVIDSSLVNVSYSYLIICWFCFVYNIVMYCCQYSTLYCVCCQFASLSSSINKMMPWCNVTVICPIYTCEVTSKSPVPLQVKIACKKNSIYQTGKQWNTWLMKSINKLIKVWWAGRWAGFLFVTVTYGNGDIRGTDTSLCHKCLCDINIWVMASLKSFLGWVHIFLSLPRYWFCKC